MLNDKKSQDINIYIKVLFATCPSHKNWLSLKSIIVKAIEKWQGEDYRYYKNIYKEEAIELIEKILIKRYLKLDEKQLKTILQK